MTNWYSATQKTGLRTAKLGTPDKTVSLQGTYQGHPYPPKGCTATMQVWWDYANDRTFYYVIEHDNPFASEPLLWAAEIVPLDLVLEDFWARIEADVIPEEDKAAIKALLQKH